MLAVYSFFFANNKYCLFEKLQKNLPPEEKISLLEIL